MNRRTVFPRAITVFILYISAILLGIAFTSPSATFNFLKGLF